MLKSLALATLAATTFFGGITQPSEAATRCGVASHYGVGDGYGWQTMANGRPMDPYALTTATPPSTGIRFGARIQVTNQNNGRSVVVTNTDSGPYHGGRILDLSYGAFSKIASPGSGTARVCYTILS